MLATKVLPSSSCRPSLPRRCQTAKARDRSALVRSQNVRRTSPTVHGLSRELPNTSVSWYLLNRLKIDAQRCELSPTLAEDQRLQATEPVISSLPTASAPVRRTTLHLSVILPPDAEIDARCGRLRRVIQDTLPDPRSYTSSTNQSAAAAL